jgi:polar amino acid transport system substrate-binding protein
MDEESRLSIWGVGILTVIAAAVVLVFFGGRREAAAEGTLDRIRRTGVVRIGYANEAPYGYLDSTTGEVTGEAPQIAKTLLRSMGAERIETVVTEFGSLIPGLKAGRFDMIAAGMYITPARCREIAFSNPTYVISEAFVVRRGNPLNLHSFADIADNPQARLGFVGGTVEQNYAEASKIPRRQRIIFPDNASGLAGVAPDRVDAFAATTLTVNDLLGKLRSAAVEQAEPFEDPVVDGKVARGYGAFGFRKRDADFVAEINRQLADFLGTEEHLRLVRPFGFTEEMLPEGATAEELCGAN